MSGGGGGSETKTVTQSGSTTSEPWKPSQGNLKYGLEEAKDLYKSKEGFEPYMGSTVVPYAQQTMQGTAALEGVANRALGSGGFADQMSQIGESGFTAPQQGAMSGMEQFAQGAGDVNTYKFGKLYGKGLAPSFSQRNLLGVAKGDYVNGDNADLDYILSRASDEAAHRANMNASGGGRYGSAFHQGEVGREVADVQAQARLAQYNRERANQMQANQMLDQQRLAGLGFAGSMAGQEANNMQNNYQRQMGAIKDVFASGQQGIQNQLTGYNASKAPIDDLYRVGGMGEDLMARQMNDELRIFNEQQAAPLSALQNYMALSSGAGALGGTGTSRQVQQSPNTAYQSPASSAFGNALTGYAMGGIPGAALGGLSGLFG